MPKSARKTKAAADKVVYDAVDQYLNKLLLEKQNESVPLVQKLMNDVSHFRRTRTRSSKLDEDYDLLVRVIEYHFDAQGWEIVATEIDSFGELDKRLAEEVQPCVRAQLIYFSLNEDLPIRHFGKASVRQERRRLKSIASVLLSSIGAKWGLSGSQIWQLRGFRGWLPKPRSSQLLLPSLRNDQPQAPNIDSIMSMAVTADPEPFENDLTGYIDQRHCEVPRRESVTFYYDGQHGAYWRGIVVCSTAPVMDRIVGPFIMAQTDEIKALASDPRLVMRETSALISRTAVENLSRISGYLEAMTYEARKSPSYAKADYILHLQDHLSLLMKLFGSENDTPGEWPLIRNKPFDQQWISRTCIDRQYIVSSAHELQKESEKLQAMIKQQVDGKNNSRTTLVAVIAAVYLPLSLATGVFGMNIKQIANKPPKWQDVVYLSLPLVAVSVAVPLCADWIYRQIQTYAGARPKVFRWWLYWGPALAVAAVVICIVVVVEVTKH